MQRLILLLTLIVVVSATATRSLAQTGKQEAAIPQSSLSDYSDRVHQAYHEVGDLFDDEALRTNAAILAGLANTRKLLPVREDVLFGEQRVPVDNFWVTEAVDRLTKEFEQRPFGQAKNDRLESHQELVELNNRLYLLMTRLNEVEDQSASAPDQRARLESILSRPEYRPEVDEESRVRPWIRRMWDAFVNWLSRLSPERPPAVAAPGGSLNIIRVLIGLALIAALIFGLSRLWIGLWTVRSRNSDEDSSTDREVLGESIADDATAHDLLTRASQFARAGDHRAAIRLTFIALLLELEMRGKVRLDRAKTNYDYLNEVRRDATLIEPMTSMTAVFESVWYGQRRASSDTYADFLNEFGKLHSQSAS